MNTNEQNKTLTTVAGETVTIPAAGVHIADPGPYTVYELISPEGKAYVGKTETPVKVRWNYGWGYRHNKALYADIKAYGWENFQKRIIAENVSKGQAQLKERLAIIIDKAMAPNGYNLRSGGDSDFGGPNQRPVNQIDLATGEVIHRWPSMRIAARALHITVSNICETAQGKHKSAGGFGWQYADQIDTTNHEEGEA
jgi:hypothetical protein